MVYILFFILIGCKPHNTEYYKDVVNYGIDSSYSQRKTILKGDISTMLYYLNVLENYKNRNPSFSKQNLIVFTDSLNRVLEINSKITLNEILDIEYISPEKLRHNNNLAYKAFFESGLKDSVSLEDFKEYILPYKLTNEIFDNWRDSLYLFHQKLISQYPELKNIDSLYNYHISKTYYQPDSKMEMRNYFPSEENYTWLNITQEGDCISRDRYTIYHLRAAGLPATFDYIPSWGNRPYARHAYVGLAHKKKQIQKLLKNSNNHNNLVDNLNAAMNPEFTHVYLDNDLPKDIYVQYEKTIPKIYRQTWSAQKTINQLIAQTPKKEIYSYLIKPNMIDVTSQYLEVSDVEVIDDVFNSSKIAYLAVFDIRGWIPVAYTPIKADRKVLFKDLGVNILYRPMTYENGSKYFGNPFILESSGKKREIVCNKTKRIDMKLIRKFPFFSYTADHVINFKGCLIEGSNDSKFMNAKILHEIDYYPFNMQQIDFKIPDTLQYVRLINPNNDTRVRIAEIECYQDSSGVMKKLEDVIYKKELYKGNYANYANIFDGDFNTYYTGNWVRLDFGTPKPISRIRFCPRNDTNWIIPGNKYELLYWDNKWVSAGIKIANDYFLNYSNIPSETIYWLKCLSEGKEERIFTYENSKQIWW